MTDLGLISLNMAATKPNNLIENDFSNQNRSKTSLYLFVNRNIMYFTKKVPTVKGRWANQMCSQRNNPYYWCPLKIFGDFRDFYFLGQPIYWTHK